jgi:hypothetical protein
LWCQVAFATYSPRSAKFAETVDLRKRWRIQAADGLAAPILSGLRESELVITHPDGTIEDGKAVRVIES